MKTLKDYEYYRTDLGVHYCSDNTEVLPLIKDKIDLVLTDPPYKINFNGTGSLEKKYQSRRKDIEEIGSNINFDLMPFLNNLQDNIDIFHAYIWMSKNTIPDILNFAIKNKYKWNILTWNKVNPIPAYHNHYLNDTEYCFYIRQKGSTFNNGLDYQLYKKSMMDALEKSKGHPTPKPLWMIEKFIKVSSKENDLILDPFLGSGTTAVACEKLNRRWIGIEISEKYCEIAKKRIQKEADQFKLGLI